MPAVDWSAPPSLAPHVGFANRAMDWIVWPGDNKTYAYVDDVDYTDPSCPGSFNSSIGLYSSDDGLSGWRYHGVVLDKRTRGDGGLATPSAIVRHGAAGSGRL